MTFPDPLPVVPGILGRHFNENGLLSRVRDRALLIRPVQLDDEPYFAVAYEGSPLGQNDSISLLTVLALLLGEDLNVSAEITTDADGKVVGRTLFATSASAPRDPHPAVDPFDASSVSALSTALATMVERANALRFEHDVAIDVAIKYLHRWNMGQLDLEIRDITSALNVLIEAPAFAPAQTTLLSASTLEALCRDVEGVASVRNLPNDFQARLRARIREVNSISMGERRRRFWEIIGFQPTTQERSALERRHIMSHKGFIDPQTRAEELALLQDIDHARTIVNEALLALLHYDGPVIEYGAGLRAIRAQSTRPVGKVGKPDAMNGSA